MAFYSMTTKYKQQGFTLSELLVVIAIGAILATIAAPSLSDLTKNSRINGAANELRSIIQLARTEAISRNAIVNLYNPNEDGNWSDDILMCQAASAIATCTSNTDNFIKKFSVADLSDDGVSNGDITIDSNDAADDTISVNAQGRLNINQVTLAICDSRTSGNRNYQLLTISVTGRPSIADLGAGTCQQ
jgi:type IV fimbrial biogenesis protein FimT